jgi:metal-dependent hydrolase (beta-lactamase superfamily II)
MSGSTREVVLAHAQDERVVWTEEPAEVMSGLFVTGRIPRITDFEDVGGAFYVDENCETADSRMNRCIQILKDYILRKKRKVETYASRR